MRRCLHLAAILCLFLAAQALPAQAPAAPFTLRVGSRIVLTDVTVTDPAGQPIAGLPASAFHITDNKEPQTLASFEEHIPSSTPSAITPSDPAIHTNALLLHPPPVLNLLVLDLNHLAIDDQMFLNVELSRLLDRLPPDQLLAIYVQHGSFGFFMQDFTTDRSLLVAALRHAIPRLPPSGLDRLTDLATLDQLAQTLAPLPGRKNVLWLSAGSPRLLLSGDPFRLDEQDSADARRVDDELEAARIAIYPIDARGLFGVPPGSAAALASQQGSFLQVAEATGGEATLNSNGIAAAASHILATSGSFYTLTFSPRNLRFDNRWHTLRVTLDRPGLHLSYRRGYFADGRNITATPGPRQRLLAGGTTVSTPGQVASPLIFSATVTPTLAVANIAKNHTRYTIHYTVPVSTVTLHTAPGKPRFVVGAAAIAVNADGHPVARRAEQVTVPVNLDVLHQHPGIDLPVDLELDLPRGNAFLSLALWDVQTGRIGTVALPLTTRRAP